MADRTSHTLRRALRVAGQKQTSEQGQYDRRVVVELVTTQSPTMTKRNLATILWFVTGWTLGSLLAAFTGLPSILALALGLSFAAIVRWDPTGLLWSRSATGRRIRPINEVAAELDKKSDQWQAAEADTRR